MVAIGFWHGSELQGHHDAQGHGPGCAYEGALAELRNGRKQGHWIWFILPQLRDLGCSPTSQDYGINDLAEAQAYLADPFLAQRLESVIKKAVISCSSLARPSPS